MFTNGLIKNVMITLALICFPILMALILFGLRGDNLVRWTALLGSMAEAGWAIFAWINYLYYCKCSLRFEAYWLEVLGISGKFDMNGLSMTLTLVITLLVPMIILFSWERRIRRRSLYLGIIFLIEMLVILVAAYYAG